MTSIAVIGAGHWGKNIIRVMHELGHLSAVCDTNMEVVKHVAEQYKNVSVHTNPVEIFNNESISAVMIATQSQDHFTLAQDALLAGKDVFVEKPMALTVEEGQKLVTLAKKHQRILMVGHLLQYHPAIVKIRELLINGELGDLCYIHAQRLNFGKFRKEENSLWSFAPHDFSLALSIADSMPLEAHCHGTTTLSKYIADTTFTHLVFPEGMHGYFYVSWLYPVKEQRFVVVGSKKMVVFDDQASDTLMMYPYTIDMEESLPLGNKEEGQPVALSKEEPLKVECTHFIECITNRTEPRTNGEEGVKVLTILDACQQSLDTGNTISLHYDE